VFDILTRKVIGTVPIVIMIGKKFLQLFLSRYRNGYRFGQIILIGAVFRSIRARKIFFFINTTPVIIYFLLRDRRSGGSATLSHSLHLSTPRELKRGELAWRMRVRLLVSQLTSSKMAARSGVYMSEIQWCKNY